MFNRLDAIGGLLMLSIAAAVGGLIVYAYAYTAHYRDVGMSATPTYSQGGVGTALTCYPDGHCEER